MCIPSRKAMTNLDSVLKSRDNTLLINIHIVKAMVFPVVMYGCEIWTIRKSEYQRTDPFKLWCWRRIQCTWVWVNSGSWWWTGRPGVLLFMGLQRVGHNWETELNWTPLRLTRLISLLSKGLSGVFSSTTVQRHQFFGVLPLRPSSYNHTRPLGRPWPWLYRPLSTE